MDFVKLKSNVQYTIDNIETIVLEAAMKSKEEIADLNTSQLEVGLTSENKLISPSYYSNAYTALKKAMGKKAPGSTPDLKFEGDFYAGFYAELKDGWIELHSRDYKEAALRKKYSDEIFGLTKGNLTELTKLMVDDLIKSIRNELTGS